MSHNILSPSAAHRWSKCFGSIPDTLGAIDESSEFADEGTAAHTMAAWALSNGKACAQYPHATIDVLNDDGSVRRTFAASEEMKSYVQVYVDSINDRQHASALVLVEQRVSSGIVSQLYGSADGTGDAIIISPEFKLIEIHDLKYGRGERVVATENDQLRLYGLGALNLATSLGYDTSVGWNVRMVIHQPRLDHMSDELLSVQELRAWGIGLQQTVNQIDTGDLTYRPGDKTCRWCTRKASCHALAQFTLNAVTSEFPDVNDLTDWGIGKALEKADLIEQWLSAVRKAAWTALNAGQAIPGWKLVQGRQGNREWTKPEEVEGILRDRYRMNREQMYDSKLISPTTAEKLLSKSNPGRWDDLQHYIVRKPGPLALARDDDKRPAAGNVLDAFK